MKHRARWYWNRFFWFFVSPMRQAYRFVRRPHTLAVKCLVECDGGFLLVRLTYNHKQWTMVGGGLSRGETFEDAAKRELLEEVGIVATSFTKIGEYTRDHDNMLDTVHVFYCRVNNKAFTIDDVEIAEARWFKPNDLPTPRREIVDRIFKMYNLAHD